MPRIRNEGCVFERDAPPKVNNAEEIIRIISARQATRKERQAYAGLQARPLRHSGIDRRRTAPRSQSRPPRFGKRQTAHRHSHRPATAPPAPPHGRQQSKPYQTLIHELLEKSARKIA